MASPDPLNLIICDCIAPLLPVAPLREKFRTCSDIEQAVDATASSNVVSTPSDVPGWECFSPADPTRPAWLTVRLRKDRDQIVFYPRLGGPANAIDITAMDTATQGRNIFHFTARAPGWTPISSQYSVDLRCVRHGYSRADFDVLLRIKLTGKATQIWHKGGLIFF